jgi:hypothetical protein
MTKRRYVAALVLIASMTFSQSTTAHALTPAQEAATVRTPADLGRVSPAARALFLTPARTEHRATLTPIGMADRVTAAFIGPPSASHVWPPGCYTISETDSEQNFLGWTLDSLTVAVGNWCWGWGFGGWWIGSLPWWWWTVSTHWGMVSCGLEGQLAGWVDYPWEFGAAVVDRFGQLGCWPYTGHAVEAGLWVYGNGSYASV